MSDIAAVVLTIGEETTQRAIDSVNRQTLPPEEIIIIKNITPFYRALNLGASRVKTDFFVQVDSDMILDENCLEDLKKCMVKDVGIAVGLLRDPIIGRISSIKMLRKKCFEEVQFKNSISPDTDFGSDILRYGWKTVFALRFSSKSDKNLWHTFGEHRPVYIPLYTFSKYTLEGRRLRYWKRLGRTVGPKSMLTKLKNSSHEMALIAQIAICHGIFTKEERDMLEPFTENEDFNFLERFLNSSGSYKINKFKFLNLFFLPKTVFKEYYKLGIDLRNAFAFPAFRYCVDLLNKSSDDCALIAKIGLCHGLFSEDYSKEVFENDYAIFKEFIPQYNWLTLMKMKFKHLKKLLTYAVLG